MDYPRRVLQITCLLTACGVIVFYSLLHASSSNIRVFYTERLTDVSLTPEQDKREDGDSILHRNEGTQLPDYPPAHPPEGDLKRVSHSANHAAPLASKTTQSTVTESRTSVTKSIVTDHSVSSVPPVSYVSRTASTLGPLSVASVSYVEKPRIVLNPQNLLSSLQPSVTTAQTLGSKDTSGTRSQQQSTTAEEEAHIRALQQNATAEEEPRVSDSSSAPSFIVQPDSSSAPSFTVQRDFTFPHPTEFLRVGQVLEADWVKQLKSYLTSIYPARTVTITVATESFIPNLLNWLISATLVADPPLEHIIAVAFDTPVYQLLTQRRLTVILVPYNSVLKNRGRGVSNVWMARFAVIRLLNHWGYDVQQFDTDAVMLRNPRPLYERYPNYEIVSARGKLPFELGRGPWGFTVCMGAVLLRSTERMERLWNAMHNNRMESTKDDQRRINYALYHSKLQWKSKELRIDRENVGINQNGLKVVVLPPMYICRVLCTLNNTLDYYVWHQPGGGHSASWKVRHDSKSHVWFLHSDWMKAASKEVTGTEWLRAISNPASVDHARTRYHEHHH